MRKLRYLLAFILCWLASSVTLYALNRVWHESHDISLMRLILAAFAISAFIVTALYLFVRKGNT